MNQPIFINVQYTKIAVAKHNYLTLATAVQVKLIAELETEEKNMIFKMVDTFLAKKKFKDFFAKNVASL